MVTNINNSSYNNNTTKMSADDNYKRLNAGTINGNSHGSPQELQKKQCSLLQATVATTTTRMSKTHTHTHTHTKKERGVPRRHAEDVKVVDDVETDGVIDGTGDDPLALGVHRRRRRIVGRRDRHLVQFFGQHHLLAAAHRHLPNQPKENEYPTGMGSFCYRVVPPCSTERTTEGT